MLISPTQEKSERILALYFLCVRVFVLLHFKLEGPVAVHCITHALILCHIAVAGAFQANALLLECDSKATHIDYGIATLRCPRHHR